MAGVFVIQYNRYLRSVIIAIGLVVIVVVIVSIFSHYLIQIGQPKENGATPIINNGKKIYH